MKFVAGDLNIQSMVTPEQALTGVANANTTTATAAPQVKENPFFEYHLYSVNATTTIRDKEMKQIQMINVPGISADKVYDYDIPPYTATTDPSSVATSLSFNNT